jgi:hypothetical protein
MISSHHHNISVLPPFKELAFPSEWEHPDDELMFANDDGSVASGGESNISSNIVLPPDEETLGFATTNMLAVLGPWKGFELSDADDGLAGDGSEDDIMLDVAADRPFGPSSLWFDEEGDDGKSFVHGGSGGGGSCESPTGPVEEFHNSSSGHTWGGRGNVAIDADDEMDHGQFLAPFQPPFPEDGKAAISHDDHNHQDMTMMMMASMEDLGTVGGASHHYLSGEDHHDQDSIIGLSFEERYRATIEKLQASMERSQETRKSLLIRTAHTEKYERLGSVREILSSIATSSKQVQRLYSSCSLSSSSSSSTVAAATRQHSI